jgi:antitoxin CptB
MLENDIILARFLDAHATSLTTAQVTALDRLLEVTDNELWDLLSGRTETADPALVAVLQELRVA